MKKSSTMIPVFDIPFRSGDQIAYIPEHVNINKWYGHKDIELGFITSITKDGAFCRFWSKFEANDLRTKANSELTPIDRLVHYANHKDAEIEAVIKKYNIEMEE